MFERIVSIDWSGANSEEKRVTLRVAIWDRGANRSWIQPPSDNSETRGWTRTECRTWLVERLAEEKRTLVAMDFGFGLPWGADQAIFGVQGWRGMIRRVGEEYAKAGTARTAAQAINSLRQFSGHGPYRFNENRTDFRFYLDHGIAYYRLTELAAPQAISQWYLGSGGTVGFHTITGMSAIDYLIGLREEGKLRFSVWPFEEPGADEHVLVESYPAICPTCADDAACRNEDERDAWKVLRFIAQANENGEISLWFDLPNIRFGRVEGIGFEEQVRFEGFIFGLR